MEEIIKSTKELQKEIDKCLTLLINGRTDKDQVREHAAMFRMESLIVASMQQLQCCIDKLEECWNNIKWQTGEPPETGMYLVTVENKYIATDYFGYFQYDKWRHYDGHVTAWCKLSDIQPYKGKEVRNEH